MLKIGIFFGGSSREREISFVGGRTIYDRLDRSLFEPIPIFVDSLNNFIILNWQYLYKGTIRDFYPSKEYNHDKYSSYIELLDELSKNEIDQLINKVGIPIYPHEFKSTFAFAFLTLLGVNGEDGTIQGILEWYGIPYSGTRILGSAINVDKEIQRNFINSSLNYNLDSKIIRYDKWIKESNKNKLYKNLKSKFGSQFVCKSCKQGSSIGISIIKSEKNFEYDINRCFFIKKIEASFWKSLTEVEKDKFIINEIIDVRHGIGMPVMIKEKTFYSGKELIEYLNDHFTFSIKDILLESIYHEEKVIIEPYLKGREFSCIVIEDNNNKPLTLPLTELKVENYFFDYRAKYLPGMVNKTTPMNITYDEFLKIKNACEKLYIDLHCDVYARIDGFLTEDGKIYLNDPNTTSGMNPSSFLFHQSAEVGFTPTQFLTYLIKKSFNKAIKNNKALLKQNKNLLSLESLINKEKTEIKSKTRVGVLMGGFSSERHISLESGRNIYDKLSSSKEYEPIPIFLSGDSSKHRLFILPINVLLKDNADDIHQKLINESCQNKDSDKILKSIRIDTKEIIEQYTKSANLNIKEITYKSLKDYVDFIFIALHGRPGEDGEIQSILEKENISYNGSGIETCRLTIDKFKTNQFLKSHNILDVNQIVSKTNLFPEEKTDYQNVFKGDQYISIAKQIVIKKESWNKDKKTIISDLEDKLGYPMIGKPIDEGCSSAVLKLENRNLLKLYIDAIFRDSFILKEDLVNALKIKEKTEFPQKKEILIEEFIQKGNANHFLEITGGLITELDEETNNINYHIFEPSESIATNNILSLEEKFLAGEGQNITPARFSDDIELNKKISEEVKAKLLEVAKLLNIEGYARIDAFVKIYNDRIEVIIIEVNILPAMTPATCIFHQAALAGYKPFDFIKAIINYGLAKFAYLNIYSK